METVSAHEQAKGIAREALLRQKIRACSRVSVVLKRFFLVYSLAAILLLFVSFFYGFSMSFVVFYACTAAYFFLAHYYTRRPVAVLVAALCFYLLHTSVESWLGFIPIQLLSDPGRAFRENTKGMFGAIVLMVLPYFYVSARVFIPWYFIKSLRDLVRLQKLGRLNEIKNDP